MSKKTDPVMTFDDVAKKTEQFGDLLGSIENLEDKKKHLWREIYENAMALCPACERLSETQLQGSAFCKIMREVWSLEIDELTLPIALALAAKNESIDQNLVVPAYLHSFCSNLISVAMRLIPIGQTDGQKTLRELSPLISDSVRAVAKSDKDDLGSACFLSDVSAMQHEYLQPRVFKT